MFGMSNILCEVNTAFKNGLKNTQLLNDTPFSLIFRFPQMYLLFLHVNFCRLLLPHRRIFFEKS